MYRLVWHSLLIMMRIMLVVQSSCATYAAGQRGAGA